MGATDRTEDVIAVVNGSLQGLLVQGLNLRSPSAVATPIAATSLLLSLLFAVLRARQRELVTAVERAQAAAVVDSAHDAIIRHTSDGQVLAWNAAAERLLGWRLGEIRGRSLLELTVPLERREEALAVMARVQRGENVPGTPLRCSRNSSRAPRTRFGPRTLPDVGWW
jgi:PAS domain-containing protein